MTATHAFWPYSFKVTTKPDILLLVQAVTMRFFFPETLEKKLIITFITFKLGSNMRRKTVFMSV